MKTLRYVPPVYRAVTFSFITFPASILVGLFLLTLLMSSPAGLFISTARTLLDGASPTQVMSCKRTNEAPPVDLPAISQPGKPVRCEPEAIDARAWIIDTDFAIRRQYLVIVLIGMTGWVIRKLFRSEER
ncbi:hypothetical protein ACI2I2_19915 [Scandinavium sp. NPDC088450]|uniref:hypothetical protein n=1 Tax=Scandinavium sp. NPDC088450 TaxID=3364514 RepID=UPI0038505BD6